MVEQGSMRLHPAQQSDFTAHRGNENRTQRVFRFLGRTIDYYMGTGPQVSANCSQSNKQFTDGHCLRLHQPQNCCQTERYSYTSHTLAPPGSRVHLRTDALHSPHTRNRSHKFHNSTAQSFQGLIQARIIAGRCELGYQCSQIPSKRRSY